MREIALLAPSSVLSSDDAGAVSRFIVGALLLSHGARRDVRAMLFFDGSSCISFEGGSMRNVRPDEQSLLGIIRAGLKRLQDPRREGAGGRRVMQGINAFSTSLEDYVKDAKGMKVFYSGAGGRTVELRQDFTAFFQYPELDGDVRKMLSKNGFVPVRLGSCQVAQDQAVVLLNNLADRAEAGS